MDEAALTDAVETDLPSPKPTRKRRWPLRLAAFALAGSQSYRLGLSDPVTRRPDTVVRLKMPTNFNGDSSLFWMGELRLLVTEQKRNLPVPKCWLHDFGTGQTTALRSLTARLRKLSSMNSAHKGADFWLAAPDGSRAAVLSWDAVTIITLPKGLQLFKFPRRGISQICWSAGDRYIAAFSLSNDHDHRYNSAIIYDLEKKEKTRRIDMCGVQISESQMEGAILDESLTLRIPSTLNGGRMVGEVEKIDVLTVDLSSNKAIQSLAPGQSVGKRDVIDCAFSSDGHRMAWLSLTPRSSRKEPRPTDYEYSVDISSPNGCGITRIATLPRGDDDKPVSLRWLPGNSWLLIQLGDDFFAIRVRGSARGPR